jgi:hypothetical protein
MFWLPGSACLLYSLMPHPGPGMSLFANHALPVIFFYPFLGPLLV